MTETFHMCANVRGLLSWSNAKLHGMFVDESGRKMTGAECREALLDALSEGKEVLPIGPVCEGFDYKSGCPGHPIEEAADAKPFPNRSSAPKNETAPVAADAVNSNEAITYEEHR